jgi:hypothetical protein
MSVKNPLLAASTFYAKGGTVRVAVAQMQASIVTNDKAYVQIAWRELAQVLA